MTAQRIAEGGRRVLVVSTWALRSSGRRRAWMRLFDLAIEASIDAAILDVNIRGGHTYAVADTLAERGIPFIFCSGYSDWALEERHRDRPRLSKPYSPQELEERLMQLLVPPSRSI